MECGRGYAFLYNLTPAVPNFDSQFYFLAGKHFAEGTIDCLRTPVYPIIIYFFSNAIGEHCFGVAITIQQSLVYLISIYSFIHLVQKVIINRIINLLTLLFYVIVIAPAWCNEIATESLSLSGGVLSSLI